MKAIRLRIQFLDAREAEKLIYKMDKVIESERVRFGRCGDSDYSPKH